MSLLQLVITRMGPFSGFSNYLPGTLAFDVTMSACSLVVGVLFFLAGIRLFKGIPAGRRFGLIGALAAVFWAVLFAAWKAILDAETGMTPANNLRIEDPTVGAALNIAGLIIGVAAIGVFPVIALLKLRKNLQDA